MTEGPVQEKLPSNWQLLKINQIQSNEPRAIITGPFGSNISSQFFVDDGIPVIRGNNLSLDGKRFIDDGFVFVTPNKAKELNTWVEKGDIVLTAAGTLGQVGIIEETANFSRYVISNKQMRLRVNKNVVRPLFVFYWLSTTQMIKYIQQLNTGSTIPLINLSVLRNLPIIVPPLNEQDAILEVLNSIDSKVKVNNQINTLLENIGQALFKRWFVDSEFPNQEGKAYKSTGGKMTDSLFGEIPSNWQVGGLGDICEIVMGQSPPGETYNEVEKGIPFFQGIRDFGFRFPSKRVYCTAPTRFAEEGDVLLSVRAPVGSLNIATERCAVGRGVAALRLKGKQNSFLYYLLLATRSAWEKYGANGTVFGSATKQDVYDFKIVIPPKELRNRFGEFMESIDKKILLNEKESHNLIAIRDLLLPKLMSGKIRVPINNENLEAT